MDYYLQGFGPDGACLEGLGYWNYGFGYFVYYADLLRKRTRGEMDWFRAEKVGRIALFQQKGFWQARPSSTSPIRNRKARCTSACLIIRPDCTETSSLRRSLSGRLTATTIAAAGLRPCAT